MWGEYCRLRKEVKQLVIEKKLNIWNELVEKVNTDFDGNRKEFWAFVGRKSKGKKKNIASLKSDTGLSLTSTRGKLEVLQRHYQLLSKMSVDSVFDADWKEEVGEESWHKSQAGSLESIILDGAKRILGCSSKTCNEAVRGDMGLDTLQSRRDRAKLKWWYKLATLPEDRYPKQLFNQKWNIKPRRGRQRKVWSRMVDDLFKSLDIDKSEWLEDIKHGDSSSASFMASVEECISERESRKFEEGLNTKVKLGMYKRFGKSVEFKKYLHGICDAGSRLLFKFRSVHTV